MTVYFVDQLVPEDDHFAAKNLSAADPGERILRVLADAHDPVRLVFKIDPSDVPGRAEWTPVPLVQSLRTRRGKGRGHAFFRLDHPGVYLAQTQGASGAGGVAEIGIQLWEDGSLLPVARGRSAIYARAGVLAAEDVTSHASLGAVRGILLQAEEAGTLRSDAVAQQLFKLIRDVMRRNDLESWRVVSDQIRYLPEETRPAVWLLYPNAIAADPLARLKGSDKQIEWATTLRLEAAAALCDMTHRAIRPFLPGNDPELPSRLREDPAEVFRDLRDVLVFLDSAWSLLRICKTAKEWIDWRCPSGRVNARELQEHWTRVLFPMSLTRRQLREYCQELWVNMVREYDGAWELAFEAVLGRTLSLESGLEQIRVLPWHAWACGRFKLPPDAEAEGP